MAEKEREDKIGDRKFKVWGYRGKWVRVIKTKEVDGFPLYTVSAGVGDTTMFCHTGLYKDAAEFTIEMYRIFGEMKGDC